MSALEIFLQNNIENLRLAAQRAELVHLKARVVLLDAELAAASASASVSTASGPKVFDPAWKLPGRPHLSAEGEKAILAAYAEGASQGEVARLFQISERAAASWQQRYTARKRAAA
jgi:hypothetical protein